MNVTLEYARTTLWCIAGERCVGALKEEPSRRNQILALFVLDRLLEIDALWGTVELDSLQGAVQARIRFSRARINAIFTEISELCDLPFEVVGDEETER